MKVLMRRRDDRGAAMVEFALILPIFVMLVFGMINYGFALNYRQGLSQAVAEGARKAAILTYDDGQRAKIESAMNESLKAYKVQCSGDDLKRGAVTVGSCAIVPSACIQGSESQCVSVEVTHNYKDHPQFPSFPGLDVVIPDELSFSASIEVN